MVNLYAFTLNDGRVVASEITEVEYLPADNVHLIYHGEEENLPNPFPKGVLTPLGGHNYAFVNGEIVERSAEEVAADEEAANPTPDATTDDILNALLGVE